MFFKYKITFEMILFSPENVIMTDEMAQIVIIMAANNLHDLYFLISRALKHFGVKSAGPDLMKFENATLTCIIWLIKSFVHSH